MNLPVDYNFLSSKQRKVAREEYVRRQNGLCLFCKEELTSPVPKRITDMPILWEYFPPHFLKYPVHLQHNHETGMTEGAVHAYCNAVLWQYEGQ